MISLRSHCTWKGRQHNKSPKIDCQFTLSHSDGVNNYDVPFRQEVLLSATENYGHIDDTISQC